ncbi:MAG: (2Fe-2S)-binding protein [Mangrovicoccus sp.]
MIVCHCHAITDHDIGSAINWMRASDPDTLITPGKIFRALGKRAECGGCMPLFLSTMRKNENLEVPAILCDMRTHSQMEASHEGRPKGNRVSQQIPTSRADRS